MTDLERRPGGRLEDLPDALLALGRALEVGEGVDLLGHRPTLLGLHRLLLHLAQLLDRVGVVAQVLQFKRGNKSVSLILAFYPFQGQKTYLKSVNSRILSAPTTQKTIDKALHSSTRL